MATFNQALSVFRAKYPELMNAATPATAAPVTFAYDTSVNRAPVVAAQIQAAPEPVQSAGGQIPIPVPIAPYVAPAPKTTAAAAAASPISKKVMLIGGGIVLLVVLYLVMRK